MGRPTMDVQRRAVFLDRDGVLIEDAGLLVEAAGILIPDGVPEALRLLHEAGWSLVVVSNQAVVARGLLSEAGVESLQEEVEARLQALGAPKLDGFYYCPHHPAATLPAYRVDCDCRKPKPGLLLKAAAELNIDPKRSFMIGDRPSDLLAGRRAGCRAIWVQTGRHRDPPIESSWGPETDVPAAFVCDTLLAAARWILEVG